MAWLKMTVTTAADAALITQCAAAVEPQVERARPDMWVVTPADPDDPDSVESRVYTPDAEVMTAAVMLSAKVFRRRNSPGGLETSFDQVVYVATFDPQIQTALRQGLGPNGHRRPAVDPPPTYARSLAYYGEGW